MSTMPGSQLVTVQDGTGKGVLTPAQLFNLAWALNYQALYHYGRSQWVTGGLAPAAHVALLPHGAAPPKGAWNIELLDSSDVEGALGYHEDLAHISKAGNSGIHSTRGTTGETPLSKVFVKTSKSDGIDPAEVASHELLEMLVDPYVVKESEVRKVLHEHQYYIVEVGDPVQGCGYDIGAPEKRHCGVTVADFALPAWFALPQVDHATQRSFRSSVKDAFEIAPQGYMSVSPENNPSEWSQIYGSDRKGAEKASDAYERPGELG